METVCARPASAPLAREMAQLAPGRRSERAEAAVLRAVAELTGAPAAALGAETPLMEAGIDSLAATELSSRLRALSGVALSPTLVFEQPTPRAIAAHVLEQARPATSGALTVRVAVQSE